MPDAALIAEATRWRVLLPVGALKGITEADAYRLAAEYHVRPDRAWVRLYADGTEELGPWSPAPMLPRLRTQAEREERWLATADSRPGYATYPDSPAGSPSWWLRHGDAPPARPVPEPRPWTGPDPLRSGRAALFPAAGVIPGDPEPARIAELFDVPAELLDAPLREPPPEPPRPDIDLTWEPTGLITIAEARRWWDRWLPLPAPIPPRRRWWHRYTRRNP